VDTTSLFTNFIGKNQDTSLHYSIHFQRSRFITLVKDSYRIIIGLDIIGFGSAITIIQFDFAIGNHLDIIHIIEFGNPYYNVVEILVPNFSQQPLNYLHD